MQRGDGYLHGHLRADIAIARIVAAVGHLRDLYLPAGRDPRHRLGGGQPRHHAAREAGADLNPLHVAPRRDAGIRTRTAGAAAESRHDGMVVGWLAACRAHLAHVHQRDLRPHHRKEDGGGIVRLA